MSAYFGLPSASRKSALMRTRNGASAATDDDVAVTAAAVPPSSCFRARAGFSAASSAGVSVASVEGPRSPSVARSPRRSSAVSVPAHSICTPSRSRNARSAGEVHTTPTCLPAARTAATSARTSAAVCGPPSHCPAKPLVAEWSAGPSQKQSAPATAAISARLAKAACDSRIGMTSGGSVAHSNTSCGSAAPNAELLSPPTPRSPAGGYVQYRTSSVS